VGNPRVFQLRQILYKGIDCRFIQGGKQPESLLGAGFVMPFLSANIEQKLRDSIPCHCVIISFVVSFSQGLH
jgi:hypothetical protein